MAVKGFVGAVGQTPLIELGSLSARLGRRILAKAEFMNPGGSVKDRAALGMLQRAMDRGELAANGLVVEGTAGNTGIGLAHMCRAMSLRLAVYVPNTQSEEKLEVLRQLGAEVHAVPVKPHGDPENFNSLAQARADAEGHGKSLWTNQFDNKDNRAAHFTSTGPEIWQQTGGRVNAFTCATGTGGTYSGVASFLKQCGPVQCALADPPGSVLFNHFQHGHTTRQGTGSITEGIGQGRITGNLEGAPVDFALHIPDTDSVRMAFYLLHEEGLWVGASSGLNVCAAVETAKRLPRGSTIVTILCDSGARYAQRLFSRHWLESKQLLSVLEPTWMHYLHE